MSFNLQIPNKNTVIGNVRGDNVLLSDLQLGLNFTCSNTEFKDSIGINISQITINSNGDWRQTKSITYEQGISVFISYFNKNIYPEFQHNMPELAKSDAFGYFVCKALPTINKMWNATQWYKNATTLIENGRFN